MMQHVAGVQPWANGGQVDLTTTNQTLTGAIEVDTVSTLNFYNGQRNKLYRDHQYRKNAEGGTAVDNNAVITVEEGDMDIDRECHNHYH